VFGRAQCRPKDKNPRRSEGPHRQARHPNHPHRQRQQSEHVLNLTRPANSNVHIGSWLPSGTEQACRHCTLLFSIFK
jgi:hypothetical protein